MYIDLRHQPSTAIHYYSILEEYRLTPTRWQVCAHWWDREEKPELVASFEYSNDAREVLNGLNESLMCLRAAASVIAHVGELPDPVAREDYYRWINEQTDKAKRESDSPSSDS